MALGRQRLSVVTGDQTALRLPLCCAGCGAAAGHSRCERGWQATAGLIVPYCSDCLRHVARPRLLALAATLASLLSALAAAVLLPLGAGVSVLMSSLGALVFATVPLLLCWGLATLGFPGQLTCPVFFTKDGLVCARHAYALELAQLSQSRVVRRWLRPRLFNRTAWFGPLTALVLTPFAFELTHPPLRVINLADERIVVFADRLRLGDVLPSSSESPAAGQEFRVPAGRHQLVARTIQGQTVASVSVRIAVGRAHLFAPGAPAGCFWLERRAYGKERRAEHEREPLESEERFWVMPSEVDSWFVPLPEEDSSLVSGGLLTALRQGHCR